MATTETEQSIIKVLSPQVIEKIAAGEVVEKPASVVKELIENSIDAGATHIDVTIEDAGFSLIKIADNGTGMSCEDLKKCVIAHATSKISSAEDLFSVGTMGFRGEAMASVAAISRLSVSSCCSNDGLGFSIKSEGGEVSAVKPMQHVRGTVVTCRDLFYNVPARKKFMKSRKAERMAITRLLEQLVLAFPSIHFTSTIEGKRSLDVPVVNDHHKRIAQVAGANFAEKLVVCHGETDAFSAYIYISDPQDARARPRFQNLYVNLRRIDNDSVSYGVREAFSRFITSSLRPSWFCFLDIEPEKIDVNVHPTKQKIKFDDEKELFSFVYRMVHSGLSDHIRDQIKLDQKSIITHPIDGRDENPNSETSVNMYRSSSDRATNTSENTSSGSGQTNYTAQGEGQNSYSSNGTQPVYNSFPSMKIEQPVSEADDDDDDSEQMSLSFMSVMNNNTSFIEDKIEQFGRTGGVNHVSETVSSELSEEQWNLIPCYQIHKRYILAPIKNGIVIIDQHAAHERILYEDALDDLSSGKGESQRLLFPIVFDMTDAEKGIVLDNREYFGKLGFDIQDFGGKSIAVSSMPAAGLFKSSDVEESVREIVNFFVSEKDKDILSEAEKHFAASFACGSAIRFGKPLQQEEMNMLLNRLFAARNPLICPHGRPTLIRMSLSELAHKFLR